MDSPPVLLGVGTELGQAYVSAMELAGEYAYAGRDVVLSKVLEILGGDPVHDKRLPEVLDAHAGSIRVKHTLRPLGVAMAGRDVFDPHEGLRGRHLPQSRLMRRRRFACVRRWETSTETRPVRPEGRERDVQASA